MDILVICGIGLACTLLLFAIHKESLILLGVVVVILLVCLVAVVSMDSEEQIGGYCPECGAKYSYCPIDGARLVEEEDNP